MEVVIWGVTSLGRYSAKHLVNNSERIKPLAFIDNDQKLQGDFAEGVPIISYDDLKRKDNLEEITILLAVRNSRNILEILEQLKDIQAAKIGIIKTNVGLLEGLIDICKKEGEIVWSLFEREYFQIIPRIEINLIDACNLKCKGCTHFSSIFNEDNIYSLNNFKQDLFRLKEIGRIFKLRLLGGEPLLLKNLDEYLTIARDICNEADIEIITNGLLIPQSSEKVMSALRHKEITVGISPYYPTLKKREEIVGRLMKHNIRWYFEGEKIEYFSRSFTLENTHNAEVSNNVCTSAMCTFLRQGKLYKCPFEGLIQSFCDYYELDWRQHEGVDIYQDKKDVYEKLVSYVFGPTEMCKYCAEKPEYIPWSVKADPDLKDWLYMEGQK